MLGGFDRRMDGRTVKVEVFCVVQGRGWFVSLANYIHISIRGVI